jgi:hypothetical protein
VIDDILSVPLKELTAAYEDAIPSAFAA